MIKIETQEGDSTRQMEAKVGHRLFERSTRKVEPTLWAEHLHGYACEILGTMDAAERTMRSLANLEMGQIDVAASPMMYGLLAGPLQQLHALHPGIHTGRHELSTDASIDYVLNGQADFGLVSMGEKHPLLQIEPLYEESMYVVYAPGHPLAGQEALTWEQVAAQPHISLHATGAPLTVSMRKKAWPMPRPSRPARCPPCWACSRPDWA